MSCLLRVPVTLCALRNNALLSQMYEVLRGLCVCVCSFVHRHCRCTKSRVIPSCYSTMSYLSLCVLYWIMPWLLQMYEPQHELLSQSICHSVCSASQHLTVADVGGVM